MYILVNVPILCTCITFTISALMIIAMPTEEEGYYYTE